MGNVLYSLNEETKSTNLTPSRPNKNNIINKKLSEVQRKLYDDYMGVIQDPTIIDPEYDGYKKLASKVKDSIPKNKYKASRKKANK